MASWDIKKYGGQSFNAVLWHIERDEETAEKMKEAHPRKYDGLNPAMTKYNMVFNDHDGENAQSYIWARMDYLDATTNQNKRKNRSVLSVFELPLPEWIDDPLSQEAIDFCQFSVDWLERQVGSENLVCGVYHVDEIHDYIDPIDRTTKTSRGHIHVPVMNVDAEGQFNSRAFFRGKSDVAKFQKAFDDVVFEKYGKHYQTGRGDSRGRVDDLKIASAAALNEEKEKFQKEKDAFQKEKADFSIEKELFSRHVKAKTEELENEDKRLSEALSAAESRSEALEQQALEQAQIRASLAAQQASIDKDKKEIAEKEEFLRDCPMSKAEIEDFRRAKRAQRLQNMGFDQPKQGITKEQDSPSM